MATTPTLDWRNALTKAQLRDSAWEAVKARAELRLATLMKDLCSTNIKRKTEQVIRGRIAELNELLALETAPAPVRRRGSTLRDAATPDEGDDETP